LEVRNVKKTMKKNTSKICNTRQTICLLTVFASLTVSCESESKADKQIKQAVEQANAGLPNRANDWMWKDSITYNAQEKTVYNYFSYHVDKSLKPLFRKTLSNTQLGKTLLLTEDLSVYLENNVSMGVINTFEDGEVISKIVITPKEMRKISTQGIDYRDLTEYVYANMAISLSAVCPYIIDQCFTITRADFDSDKMEFFLYWNIDKDCLQFLVEKDIREMMREYIARIIKQSKENLLELERHTTPSSYKRSDYPVKVTLVCTSSNGFSISESMLSTDVSIY